MVHDCGVTMQQGRLILTDIMDIMHKYADLSIDDKTLECMMQDIRDLVDKHSEVCNEGHERKDHDVHDN